MAMAHSLVAAHSLTSRFSALFLDGCSPSSESHYLALPSRILSSSSFSPSSSRILRLNIREKSRRSLNLKVGYSDGFRA